MTEEEIQTVESVANTLRGMALDPMVPSAVRHILRDKADVLDEIVEDNADD